MDSDVAQLEVEPRSVSGARAYPRLIGLAFTLAVFLSAALLFIVEPMFGKLVLPLLGGSPAVWTTCMLFFQGALLLGYLYAHVGPLWMGVRLHSIVHLALLTLCCLLLPLGLAHISANFRLEHPTWWLLVALSMSLGPAFVLLSSTGPLLQLWFSKTTHVSAHNPYFLYAASNAGSLIALLSYPFLIEPAIPLNAQTHWWSVGYVTLVVLVFVSAAYLRTSGRLRDASGSGLSVPRVGVATLLRWTVLAFVPSSFFLALTTYITTDIAAVPLLWVIPLVLYLLSFMMVFSRRVWLSHSSLLRWQPVGLIALIVVGFWGPSGFGPWLLILHLIVFFVTALVCHGELAATRPEPSHLTQFYLCLAVGGVLGGVFNAVIAPAVFNSVLEYPLTLLIACGVRPLLPGQQLRRSKWWELLAIAAGCTLLVGIRLSDPERQVMGPVLLSSALVAMACLRMSRDPARFTLAVGLVVLSMIVTGGAERGVRMKERNFFGVREIREDLDKQMRWLMHGTTNHGAQSTNPANRRTPITYYYPGGPIGDVFRAFPPLPRRKVGVIGLGAGGLAAYAGAGEEWTFYEIDPDIIRVAEDTNYFTYLKDTPAKVRTILGDGRLSIADAPDHYYDMLVLDAFSSDAIPTHLLTFEALSVYRRKLSETGILALHLSNRYLDLEPVVGRLVHKAGVVGLIRKDTIRKEEPKFEAYPSAWAVIASNSSDLGALQNDTRWRPLRVQERVGLWTDDFSNIFSVFIWSVPPLPGHRAASKAH